MQALSPGGSLRKGRDTMERAVTKLLEGKPRGGRRKEDLD